MSFGSAFIIAGFCVTGRKYRKFLIASQNSHREKWHSRGCSGAEHYEVVDHGGDLKMMTITPAGTPIPRYGRSDEHFLPDDVHCVVESVIEVQLQHRLLPAKTYGSVARKPLPGSRDFCDCTFELWAHSIETRACFVGLVERSSIKMGDRNGPALTCSTCETMPGI